MNQEATSSNTEKELALLDTSGLNCPLPLLRLKKYLTAIESGTEFKVVSTDPASVIDFGVFCEQMGHTIMSQDENQGMLCYLIKKA